MVFNTIVSRILRHRSHDEENKPRNKVERRKLVAVYLMVALKRKPNRLFTGGLVN